MDQTEDRGAGDELRTKLEAEVDVVEGAPLLPHAKRDALFFVDGRLDLLDVAVAVARDRVPLVRFWMTERLLRRPTDDEREQLARSSETRYRVVIVQPYVLAQRQAGSA